MATARRRGTNEVDHEGNPGVATFGSGRDFSSLETWESDADRQQDNVTAQESPTIECYDDSASFTTLVDFNGATNDLDKGLSTPADRRAMLANPLAMSVSRK